MSEISIKDLIPNFKSITDLDLKDTRYDADIIVILTRAVEHLSIIGLPYYKHRRFVTNIMKDTKVKEVSLDLSWVELIRGAEVIVDGKTHKIPFSRYARPECCECCCECGKYKVMYSRDGNIVNFSLDRLPIGEFVIEYDGSLDSKFDSLPARYKDLVLFYSVYDFCAGILRDEQLGMIYKEKYERELVICMRQNMRINAIEKYEVKTHCNRHLVRNMRGW